jgi:hypothetical protein
MDAAVPTSPSVRQGDVDDRDVHDADEHRGNVDDPDGYLLADGWQHGPTLSLGEQV